MLLEQADLASLITDVIERMPRIDSEAVALRILGTLDRAGYEIRRKADDPQIVGFAT
jgi:hypothetical protein